MKCSDLWSHFISVHFLSHGHYKVSFSYRKKVISFTTTNSLAIDRLYFYDLPSRSISCGYTERQALQWLYDNCKKANNIYF